MKENPQMITIETPEHIELQLRLAGIGTRFLAFLVDKLIQVGIILASVHVVLLLMFLSGYTGIVPDIVSMFTNLARQWIIAAAILFYGVVIIGYFILFEYFWSGSTPGKRWLDIRVIRKDGRPITFADAAVRNILRAVDILGEIYPIGLVVMFFDSLNRRLGDLAAGTLVVVDNCPGGPPSGRSSPEMAGLDPAIRRGAERMTPRDYRLVTKFLARRDGLELRHRRELAEEICRRILSGERFSVGPTGDHEALLEQLEAMYRERTRVL